MWLINLFKNIKSKTNEIKKEVAKDYVSKDDTFLKDYNLLPCNVKSFYYVPKNLQSKISWDLMSLNRFIGESRNILKANFELISDLNLRYNINTDKYFGNLTKIELATYTKTGKMPKFPVVLYFNASKSMEWPNNFTLMGDVYYFPDGKMGKVEIISWVNNSCFVLSIRIKNNEMTLTRIHTIDNETAKKVLIYQHSN